MRHWKITSVKEAPANKGMWALNGGAAIGTSIDFAVDGVGAVTAFK
jgi:hypothetical protein